MYLRLSVCPSVCLSVCVCMYVCMSVCMCGLYVMPKQNLHRYVCIQIYIYYILVHM